MLYPPKTNNSEAYLLYFEELTIYWVRDPFYWGRVNHFWAINGGISLDRIFNVCEQVFLTNLICDESLELVDVKYAIKHHATVIFW